MSHYSYLSLPPSATATEIQCAYETLSEHYHPHAQSHADGEQRETILRLYQGIQEAWAVLRDPTSKKIYDQELVKQEKLKWIKWELKEHDWREYEARCRFLWELEERKGMCWT
ncbi:uncharacterized protein BDZ99DRAFT_518684 [Mytilinidion resinicola]|uniref:J domain-containing protein n=1 Tax=Mytilinidion resinicola TaxID=574789 RepID=A0A6A6YTR3_9PEZI|nr:uncharacterized protein BDZ99DRAFT_518684 [Mytilinidion resinicola]KAF2811404.1 hypothetical protein BDZ99DRAFT_518684 [Mytilinidion resinicola]